LCLFVISLILSGCYREKKQGLISGKKPENKAIFAGKGFQKTHLFT
jgi:hypothetical protein